MATLFFIGVSSAQTRGDDYAMFYATPAGGTSNPGIFKTTVGAPNGGTKIAEIGNVAWRSMEWFNDGSENGVIYAITWNAGVCYLGTLDQTTGAFTIIGNSVDAKGLAVNPRTGIFYATASNEFGAIDIETGAFTKIANLPDYYTTTIAIDNDGICYAISTGSSNLAVIDLTTGEYTAVGPLGISPVFDQNISIDRETNELYWASRTNSGRTFYRINKSSGALTNLGVCAQDYQAFCIVGGIHPDAPAQVENLTLSPDISGALTATLSWTNPSLNSYGGTLSDLTAIKVYKNDEPTPIYTLSNPASGGAETYTVTVTSSELYTYTVVGENSAGAGRANSATAWIGEDLPAAPENMELIANGLSAQLSWTAPATGLHGGYFNAASLLYDVYRMPSNELVSGNLSGTAFTETITHSGAYSYRVVAKNLAGNGGEALSNVVKFCLTVSTFPWQEGFENNGTALPLCWEQEYVVGNTDWVVTGATIGSPNSASEGAYKLRMAGGGATKGHTTKLITPPMDLSVTGNPALKFWHAQRNWGGDQDVSRIYYKTSSSGNWVLLATYLTDVPNWTERIIELPEISSEFYIAFEASLNFGYGVMIDEVSIVDLQSFADAELVEITSPKAGYNENLTENEQIKVKIKNNGFDPLYGVKLRLEVNGTAVATETCTGFIEGWAEVEYSFSTTVNLSNEGEYTISVTVVANGDAVPENDSKTVKIINIVEDLLGFPLEEGFEGDDFPPAGWTIYDNDSNEEIWHEHLFTHSGKRSAVHWFNEPMQEGWLITPQMKLPNNMDALLEFWSFNYMPQKNYHSGIWISTTDASITSFTLLKQLSGDAEISAAWKKIVISLSEYAGQNVYIAFKYMGNEADSWYIDDVAIHLPGIDGAARSIAGAVAPMVGEPFLYKVVVENTGTEPITNYTVKLVDDDLNILAVETGFGIAQGESVQTGLVWAPETAGSLTLHAVLEVAGDINPVNNKSSAWTFTVAPNGGNLFEGKIGTDNRLSMLLPVNFSWKTCRTQSIYFDHEIIGRAGKIIQIQYFNDFVSEAGLKPIQIWMANTTVNSLEAWLPESEFTLVFNGEIYFPIGHNTIEIPLDMAFEYEGKNLVIMTNRPMDTEEYSMNDVFYNTVTNETRHRSRHYNSDTEEFNWTQPGVSVNWHPNIVLNMALGDLGSLSGIVSNGTTSVEGASVEIVGTNLKRKTGEEGNFSFAIMTTGEHQVKASKFGYQDVTVPITIAPNVNTTVELTLTPLPTFTMSGKVTGANSPEGLQNVTIKLTGYDHYTVVTDEAGNYSITNIYGNFTYQIQATIKGYETYSADIEVNTNTTHNIALVEIPYPVFNPVAEIVNNAAVIKWDAPQDPVTFRYDNGICTGQLGFQGAAPNGVMGSCHRENALLTKMSWYLTNEAGSHTEVNLFIFDLDAEGQPTSKILFSALDVPTKVLEWSEYEFPQLVAAPNGFFVAMSHNTTFLALGTTTQDDEYPFVKGVHFYNANYSEGEFATIESAGFTVNFMLRAEGYKAGKASVGKTKLAKGYAIYRLVDGAPETSWEELSGNSTETTYTDTEWNTLPEGAYRYAVKVVYSGGILSEASLSNIVIKKEPVPVKENPLQNVIVYSHRNVIYIKNDNNLPIKLIEIIDLAGRVIHCSTTTGVLTAIPLQAASGIYNVRLISPENTTSTTKLTIHY